jgi:hypothetical protein
MRARRLTRLTRRPCTPPPTDGVAFISTDGGAQWRLIQDGLGLNPIVYSIAVDPNDSSKVYAATPDGIFRLVGTPSEATPLSP